MDGSHVMEYLDSVQDELLKIKETIPKVSLVLYSIAIATFTLQRQEFNSGV